MTKYVRVWILCAAAAGVGVCLGVEQAEPGLIDYTYPNSWDGLCGDFQALRDLIPRDTLLNIIALHAKCDRRFRIAMRFMQSESFSRTAMLIEQSGGYEAILSGLSSAGVNVTDIATIKDIFSCILLPVAINVGGNVTNGQEHINCASWHRTALLDDIVNAMPREKVFVYIEESLLNVTNFSEFYRIVHSPDFQKNLLRSLNSRQLSRPLRVMRRNGIDLPKLLKATMMVLSWGPDDY